MSGCMDQYKLISRWFGPDWKARSIGFGDYRSFSKKTFKANDVGSAQPIAYLYTGHPIEGDHHLQ